MPVDQRNLRKIIKELRLQLGMSQEEFAHSLGVSFASVNRWENGKTSPSKLARAQIEKFAGKMTRSKD
ncbi:MAG TPA: transcriptional regulator [Holosporales bacterium]|nr:transcriptional regulator [Holosporales bacterium]